MTRAGQRHPLQGEPEAHSTVITGLHRSVKRRFLAES
jgi:hypothetical protein